VHTGVVFLVAMIVVARKMIILGLDKYDAGKLLGLAAVIANLATRYFVYRYPGWSRPRPSGKGQ
jgi:uncharacterized membrane protein (DUF373 family)